MRNWFARLAILSIGTAFAAPIVHADTLINIDGSSTVYPITQAIAEEFQKESKGAVKVTVGISGTGGGFKKFCRGETDISNASRPISQKEIDEAKKNGIEFIELPIAYDALTVMVNPANDFIKEFKVEELKKIWEPGAQGKITKWNQVNPAWPDSEIKLYGAGSDSGTFDYFTEAIVGKAKSSRGDYTASEDDNVLVQGIGSDKHALGYFGYSYYVQNKDKLKAVPVVNKQGKAILPTVEAVKDGSYNPLSRPLFVYVNAKALSKPEVKQFVEFYLKNGSDLVKSAKCIPLPDEAYDMGLARVNDKKTGTVFAGKDAIGLTVAELFSMELKN